MASELGVQTIQHTNGTDALTVGSDGTVLRSKSLPLLCCTGYSNYASAINATSIDGVTTYNVIGLLSFDTVRIDTHNAFNNNGTTGGVYTIPISGYYRVALQVGLKNNTNYMSTFLVANNNTVLSQTWCQEIYEHTPVHNSIIWEFSAGETVASAISTSYTVPKSDEHYTNFCIEYLG